MITLYNPIEVKLTKEILTNSYWKAKKLGKLNHSILNGNGNFDGFVGEDGTKTYLGIPLALDQNDYDKDIVYKNKSFDVKTKKTSVIPKDYYEASVAAYNTKQKCDYYIFTRTYYPKGSELPVTLFIMGFYPKELYFKEAKFLKKGQKDGDNGFIVKEDCFNLPYSKLHPIEKLLQI